MFARINDGLKQKVSSHGLLESFSCEGLKLFEKQFKKRSSRTASTRLLFVLSPILQGTPKRKERKYPIQKKILMDILSYHVSFYCDNPKYVGQKPLQLPLCIPFLSDCHEEPVQNKHLNGMGWIVAAPTWFMNRLACLTSLPGQWLQFH